MSRTKIMLLVIDLIFDSKLLSVVGRSSKNSDCHKMGERANIVTQVVRQSNRN